MSHFVPSFAQGIVSKILDVFILTAEQAAHTIIYAAAHPELVGVGGQYVSHSKCVRPAAVARNYEAAKRVYEHSLELLKIPPVDASL